MQIVDADINELYRKARRSRSAETQQLVDAVLSLRKNQAQAVLLDESMTAQKVRSKLAYAAKIADVKLNIATAEDKIMFSLAGNGRKRRRRKGEPITP